MQKEVRKTEFWNQASVDLDQSAAPGRYEASNSSKHESHNHG